MKIKKSQPAFTLIEVLIATIMIGLAIAALLGANGAYTMANSYGADMSTAEFLIEQIRERTMTMAVIDPETEKDIFGPEEGSVTSYDDVDDFNDASFSPPIDAGGNALDDLAAFKQEVEVQNVSPTNFANTVASHTSNFVRIRVTVSKNDQAISEASWIRVYLEP
ncbi:prepilin-type N-terminal cleavage/methylation domain-containing protein [Planctomycetota bacterium]